MEHADRHTEAQDSWVEAKLASLRPPADWQPNHHVGLALLRRGQRFDRVIKRRLISVAALAAGMAALAVFPVTRVAAERCLDACVAGTGAISAFLRGAEPQPVSPGQGKLPTAFRLQDADGNPFTIDDYRGRVVVLNFWATWCPPCKVEIPWFIDFQRRFAERGLAVVGASMDEDGWQSVRPYLAQHPVNYRITLGTEDLTKALGGIQTIPTTVIIDRNGRVAAVHTGLVSRNTYEAEITRLLNEKDSAK